MFQSQFCSSELHAKAFWKLSGFGVRKKRQVGISIVAGEVPRLCLKFQDERLPDERRSSRETSAIVRGNPLQNIYWLPRLHFTVGSSYSASSKDIFQLWQKQTKLRFHNSHFYKHLNNDHKRFCCWSIFSFPLCFLSGNSGAIISLTTCVVSQNTIHFAFSLL